ncbi:dihydrolipoamide dehydrogenase [Halarchaeum grantii]|uniref:Dihydrolipoyl dehydrogenase n=1 Tax=Halarchaeum grantii TaxID=1193105 RepID=A0A830F8F0_9EURY|nr:dihydrolipoyl dehydrogenase [Halarchaeum grantii]GGL29258.1 dihydrolipoamide dehydrogenase [Halarchaeum grantii]
MAEERRTELAVVGAGPGGYVAAIRAAQRGVDVTLVEKDALGGTCLNVGCIPSKALAHAAGVAHRAASASEMGVHADVSVDLAQTNEWTDGVVDRLTSGVEKLCKANGVALVEGRAEFVDERTLRVERPRGSERVAFEHAVVATGSRPTEVPGFAFDGERVLDSTAALDLDAVPESLVIVGGGYIGMELSTAYAKLGCDVTVVERLDDVLAGYEDDVARAVRRRAADLGVTFRFGERPSEWRESGDGVVVTTTDGEERHDYRAEAVVVAVGRDPVLDSLNLDAIGLEANADGRLETDARGRTSVESVFAVGDVAPGPMLAHKASAEGRVVAAVVAGEDASLDERAVPTAVFTDPEVATVGLTEAEAESEGLDPVVGEFPMGASGRALTVGEPDGFVRLVADGGTGVVLGAQIVGPEASELIAEVGLALTMGATLADVAASIHTHPTLSEGVMEAAENALGEAIHTLNR